MLVGRVLVDTSVFIEYFRNGKDSLLPSLALNDEIVLSQVVRLELIKGVRKAERRVVQYFLEGLILVEGFPPPSLIEKNLLLLHGRGFNLGLPDIFILTDAIRLKCCLMSFDKEMLRAAKVLKLQSIANCKT